MKNFALAALCITIVSAQYHGNRGYSSGGGYAGHQSSSGSMTAGRSLGETSQGYSAVRAGHTSIVDPSHAGRRIIGRSVSASPVVGFGQESGGYSQGGHYGGHRSARSVLAVAPVVGHESYYGLALSSEHYRPVVGHGHRVVRSLVGAYRGAAVGNSRGYYGGYYGVGHQRSDVGGRWGVE